LPEKGSGEGVSGVSRIRSGELFDLIDAPRGWKSKKTQTDEYVQKRRKPSKVSTTLTITREKGRETENSLEQRAKSSAMNKYPWPRFLNLDLTRPQFFYSTYLGRTTPPSEVGVWGMQRERARDPSSDARVAFRFPELRDLLSFRAIFPTSPEEVYLHKVQE
jgi:hypothetical protein